MSDNPDVVGTSLVMQLDNSELKQAMSKQILQNLGLNVGQSRMIILGFVGQSRIETISRMFSKSIPALNFAENVDTADLRGPPRTPADPCKMASFHVFVL